MREVGWEEEAVVGRGGEEVKTTTEHMSELGLLIMLLLAMLLFGCC